MMAELILKDSIEIDGESGRCNIDLCFGDITKLQKKNSVDVILVSAFPGNYSPVPGTMIGALQSQLGLNVSQLSKNKFEDLRKDFSCWISQPLPENLPYRRLICFEKSLSGGGDHTKNLYDMVGSLFRAFSTLFNSNDDVSVISPILGSGNQRYSRKEMLKNMVTSCAAWMRVGMPLKSLKLVVYISQASEMDNDENAALIKSFSKLKDSLHVSEPLPKTLTRKCDALLIFAEEDKEGAMKFLTEMTEDMPDLKVSMLELKKKADENLEKVEKWTQSMEEKMLDSKRVVVFLSPNFLENKMCIDDYNLALCLSRKLNNSLLAPVYITTMPYVPTFLGMTQWIDCREEKRHQHSNVDPIKAGASHLCQTLATIPKTFCVQVSAANVFDVFISYSHRDTVRVQDFVAALSRFNPQLRIFIDREGLKTGFAWQPTLYSALSNSSLVVAFVSEHYLKSKMCHEEFAIASSQLASREFDSQLVVVQLDALEDVAVDPMFESCPSISTAEGDEKAQAGLVSFVQDNLGSGNCKERTFHMDESLRLARKKFQKRFWNLNSKTRRMEFRGPSIKSTEGLSRKLVICCHPEECDRANILRRTLLRLSADNGSSAKGDGKPGNSDLSVDIVSEDYAVGHRLIESADFVLLMLSALFCTQPSTQALLNVALALGRSGKCNLQGVIVSPLPRRPTVLHLLPTAINFEDQFWSEMHVTLEDGYPLQIPETKSGVYWRFAIFYSKGFQLALRVLSEWILLCLNHTNESDESWRMVSVSALTNIVKDGYFPKISFDEEERKIVTQLSQTSVS